MANRLWLRRKRRRRWRQPAECCSPAQQRSTWHAVSNCPQQLLLERHVRALCASVLLVASVRCLPAVRSLVPASAAPAPAPAAPLPVPVPVPVRPSRRLLASSTRRFPLARLATASCFNCVLSFRSCPTVSQRARVSNCSAIALVSTRVVSRRVASRRGCLKLSWAELSSRRFAHVLPSSVCSPHSFLRFSVRLLWTTLMCDRRDE